MNRRMNKTESKLRVLSRSYRLRSKLWFSLMAGRSLVMPWPTGWTQTDDNGVSYESADPNDHWRPWLEANVGRQGWDWDWRLAQSLVGYHDNLEITFRRGREEAMMRFAMRWL